MTEQQPHPDADPELSVLGRPVRGPSRDLETFPRPDRVTEVRFTTDEVTTVCPITGQPDFNSVEILYGPDRLCLESKSLKLYLWSFRDEGIFCEGLADRLAADVAEATAAHWVKVTVVQHVRGGIVTAATAVVGEAPVT